jgi:cytochrome c biogenesis protein CcdA
VEKLALSLLAGLLTVLSPCVLPAIPLVVGSAAQQHRYGPLLLAAGMITAFTLIGVTLASVGGLIGINQHFVRELAAFLIVLFGIVLLSEKLQEKMAKALAPIASGAEGFLNKSNLPGLGGQFMVGVLLGAIWSPCSGPTLGAAITLAAQEKAVWQAAVVMLFFAIGSSLPLLAIAYLSRETFLKHRGGVMTAAKRGKLLFGGILIVVGLAVGVGFDKKLETWMLRASPDWLIDLTSRY